MKRFVRLMAMCLVSILVLLSASVLFADRESPPRDYMKQTENGEYVFVMLAPDEWLRYQDSGIRKTYRQSGLYRNDGSTAPLWTVHWYSFQVYPSSDGRHVVRMGPWASDVEQLAVAFYRDGKEIKGYRIKDLIHDESRLRYTVSHFFWRASAEFDDRQGILLLKTTDDQSYRFSIETGEIEPEDRGQNKNFSSNPLDRLNRERRYGEKVILDVPVRVTATIIREHIRTKDVGGSYEAEMRVQKGNERFVRRTDLIGVDSASEAFEVLKNGTRWHGKYLFVRTECGGGNAWRCNRDSIFMLRAGRLLALAEVFAGDRDKPVRSYKNGYFWDVYDKFEMNNLTDHATAPAFRIALREEAGKLRVDPALTWAENHADFKRKMAEIDRLTKKRVRGERKRELEHRVLSNAVLAQYCGRTREAARLERLAFLHFEPSGLALFRSILNQVESGEYPLPRPVTLPSLDMEQASVPAQIPDGQEHQ